MLQPDDSSLMPETHMVDILFVLEQIKLAPKIRVRLPSSGIEGVSSLSLSN